MMEVRNLSVRAGGQASPVLQEVSLSFRPGAMNAVIGPSGCGKTTLVRAAVGSGALNCRGEFWLDGKKLESRSDRVGRVGYVPQFCVAHMDLTVEESLDYSLRLLAMDETEIAPRICLLLEETGLSALRNRLVGRLSGGQLRRVALALELVADPSLLFCDEVTAGLDPESEEGLLDLIRDLVRVETEHTRCLDRFLTQLKQKEDTEGRPLLDSTIVLFGTGMGDASRHSNRDLPTLVAGGGLKHGTHRSYLPGQGDERLLGDVYLTLLRQLGVPADGFAGAKHGIDGWA